MELLFDGIDEPGLNTLDVYRRERGGYEMLAKALEMEPADVLAQLQASGLRGRGGAGFAMGTKASFLPKGDMDKYVVCNADESEPGTFKDRELMQKNPHLLIEGICIAAHAVGPLAGSLSTGGGTAAARRLRSCLSSSTGRPALTSSTIRAQSSSTSGPTYSPATEAMGAMSQAPRHSNERTLKAGSSPAAATIAS